MVGTPLEQPSPRARGSNTTPPVSARGMNSARGLPLRVLPLRTATGEPVSARGVRSTPPTPRPTQEPVQVFIRMRPPRQPDADILRYSIEKPPQQTPRTLSNPVGSSDFPLPPSTPRSVGSSSVSLTLSGSLDNSATTDEHRTYEFSDVFDPSPESGTQLLQSVLPVITEQLKNGFNSSVLCYGQTGSGKTHTMHQLIVATVEVLFGTTVNHNGGSLSHSGASATPPEPQGPNILSAGLFDPNHDVVELSYIQIYGNRSYDLLSSSGGDGGPTKPASRYGEPLPKPKGVLVCEPFVLIQSAQDVMQRINDAQKRRVVSQHAMNPTSSRSHTLLSLRITKCIDGTAVQSVRVTLADLAGSERVKKSGVGGENLEEAIAINKSLSVLHAVIKASCDGDGVGVLPFRESALTLYLAPVLTNSCVFLVATISLEALNYHETKSTLEFATTAKKCVITRTKSMQVYERFRKGRAQEAIELQLQQEIETLRQRVELLQEELDIEKQKRELLVSIDGSMQGHLALLGQHSHHSKSTATGTVASNTAVRRSSNTTGAFAASAGSQDVLLKDHIQHLESQFAALQSLLRDREAEKMLLQSRKAIVDDIRSELEQRQTERNEARDALTKMLESETASQLQLAAGAGEGAASRGLSPLTQRTDAVAAMDKVCEAFLWLEEEYQKALECNEVYEKSLTALRQEHLISQQSALDMRRRMLHLEKEHNEAENLVEQLTAERNALQLKYNDLHFQLYTDKQERLINDECNALHQAANFRHAELEKVKAAFDDQRLLMETLQSRLSDVERQLEASEISRMKVLEENRARQESMVLAWSLFTPQQRGRYLSSDPLAAANGAGFNSAIVAANNAAPSSVFQGYDNIQLRATVRDLQKQLQEAKSQIEHRNYRIEDLSDELKNLQERLRHRDDEYTTLLKLDSQHVEQNEEMQTQIADLFSYLDAHNARQESLEARWRESLAEVEKLEDERKQSQRVINELTNKLDKALEELREQEQNKDVLTARLREAEAEKSTIARMRAEDQAKVAELERQLLRQQSLSNDISHKLDQAVNRKQHIVTEISNHTVQGELLKKRLLGTNGEEAKKRVAQLKKSVEHNRILLLNVTGTATSHQREGLTEHMVRNNRVANLRFEVSQLFRHQNAQRTHDYDAVSTQAGSDVGASPTQAVPAARHRDPMLVPVGSRAPPPPLQLANLRTHQPEGGGNTTPHAQSTAVQQPGTVLRKASYAPSVAGKPATRAPLPADIPPLSQIKMFHASHLNSANGMRSVSPNPPFASPPARPVAAAPFVSSSAVVPQQEPINGRPIIPKLAFNKKMATAAAR